MSKVLPAFVKKIVVSGLLLLPFAVVSSVHANPAAESSGEQTKNIRLFEVAEEQSGFNFPQWPAAKKRRVKETIPPPPPGPYMSSALSANSIKGPSFGRAMNGIEPSVPNVQFDSNDFSMDTFSPDRPWPKNLRSSPTSQDLMNPNRWMPDGGYQYAPPRVTPEYVPPVKRAPAPIQAAPYGPYNSQAYRYQSPMNMPMNMSSPSMGWSPGNRAPVNRSSSMAPPVMQPRYDRQYQSPYPTNSRP